MNIKSLVRKNILDLKPYSSARSNHLEGVLLDANENPFGSVIENDLNLNRYPDPKQTEIRNVLSKYLSVNPENIFIGVGSDEVIDLAVRIFCEPQKNNVIICEPTYGMYKVACDINDISTVTVPLNLQYDIDVKKVLGSVTPDTKMIFFCSPNNPTGNLLSKKKIVQIAKKFNGIIIVDQAYADFSLEDEDIQSLLRYKNIILLRTFSKAWGLAGIRCGYAIADLEIIQLFFKIKSPYNLNKLSSEVILKALKKKNIKQRFVAKINKEKKWLINNISPLQGIEKIYPSDANFVLFKVKNAKDIYEKLAEKGIIIRDRSNQLNLKNCLRISIGTPAENKLFLSELKKIL
ncbi:MAG: histidinol-phosphate transaminase [Ignavibacteriales bacterium CG_4_9_14_3_um_filter_34_10]|nr:MAG: histidinol-phosphate transaminase [Ignavibacteriales bacterium CG_4_9_14_3_um_filter_34_10]